MVPCPERFSMLVQSSLRNKEGVMHTKALVGRDYDYCERKGR